MSKCKKCENELKGIEITAWFDGFCEKCWKEEQYIKHPFKKGIQEKDDKIAELQQQLADYEKKLEQSNNTIDRQSSLILEQNEFIKAYNQQLVEKDKRIDELEQEREFMLDEVKNRGTCGLCEKLEEKAINVLRDKLKEKDQEIERLKANQTPTRKRLTPKNWDKYNLADKLRYRNSQVKEALIRFSNMNEMEDVLRSQLKDQCHQICEKIREKLKKCVTPTCGTYIVYYEAKNVDDTLDQIEKGGEKE